MAKSSGDFVALTKCFLCGEGDQLLISRTLRDISHLHNKVVDKTPCPKCAELMRQGIILISVKDGETDENNPYRTGNFVCVKEEFLRRVVQPADHPIFKSRMAFIEDSVWKKLGIPFKDHSCPAPKENSS